jgi:SCP-2 sterol transfer family
MSERVRYLSLEWLDELPRAVTNDDALRQLARDHEIGVTQLVSAGPEGDVTYHLQVAGGEARFGPGAAQPEDVRMEQTWDTAVAVATGDLNAQSAFVNGHIRLYGDRQRLLASQPVFSALDAVFDDVRRRTEYV